MRIGRYEVAGPDRIWAEVPEGLPELLLMISTRVGPASTFTAPAPMVQAGPEPSAADSLEVAGLDAHLTAALEVQRQEQQSCATSLLGKAAAEESTNLVLTGRQLLLLANWLNAIRVSILSERHEPQCVGAAQEVVTDRALDELLGRSSAPESSPEVLTGDIIAALLGAFSLELLEANAALQGR